MKENFYLCREYIRKVYRFFSCLFMVMALYLAFTMGIDTQPLSMDMRNPRNIETISRRGDILSRDGRIMAATRLSDGKSRRVYPLGLMGEPIIGYMSERYGRGGLEDRLDDYLRAPLVSSRPLEYITRYKPRGRDVYLTIDYDIQKIAARSLKDKRGAIVVMNPHTGEILASASSPAFDPVSLEEDWTNLRLSGDAPFLDRGINGLYPPGSVFKLFTYSTCLEEGLVTPEEVFHCTGDFPMKYPLGVYHIRESGGVAHGSVTAVDAVAYSCNIAFARMGLKLGAKRFELYGEKFGFSRQPPFLTATSPVSFPRHREFTDTLLAQSAFGQGEVHVTPLQIALMTCAFAGDGRIPMPAIIKAVRDEKGEFDYIHRREEYLRPVRESTARQVREAMVEVVNRGTGIRAAIDGVSVAGKTGSAENPFGDTHAWFAGFAPAEDPRAVVVVVIENGGSGGRVAAPIAGKVLQAVLEKESSNNLSGSPQGLR